MLFVRCGSYGCVWLQDYENMRLCTSYACAAPKDIMALAGVGLFLVVAGLC